MDQIRAGRMNFADQQKSLMANYDQMNAVNPPSLSPQGVQATYGANPLDLGSSPIVQRAKAAAPIVPSTPPSKYQPTDYPGGAFNPVNDINRFRNSKVGQFVDEAAQSAGRVMGLSPEQMSPAASTGNKFADAAANFVGGTAGYLTNPAQLEMSVGNTFFGNPAVEGIGNRIGGLVNDSLAKLARANVSRTLEAKLLSKAAQGATVGGLGGAAYAPFQTLIGGGDVKDIPRNIVDQGLMGAEFGGALGGAGALAGAGLKSLKDIAKGRQEPPSPDYSNVTLSQGKGVGAEQPNSPLVPTDIPRTTNLPKPDNYQRSFEPNVLKSEPKPLPAMTDNYLKPLSTYSDTLYRETSPERAVEMLPGSNVLTDLSKDEIYFSNKRDMALGQDKNKGVMIEFSPSDLQGQVNTSKPMWEQAYKSGDAEFKAKLNNQKAYQDAVKSVTIQKDAEMDRVTKAQLQRLLSKWESVKNEDGSTTYTRPISQPKAEPVQSLKSMKDIKGDQSIEQPKFQSLDEIRKPGEEAPKKLTKEQEPVLKAETEPDKRIRDKVVEHLDKQAEAARQRISARKNVGFVPPEGNEFMDYAIIGASHIAKGVVKAADFTETMIKEFGDSIKPNISRIYKDSMKLANDTTAGIKEKEMRRLKNIEKFAKNNETEAISDTSKHIGSKTTREIPNVKAAANKLYTKTIDNQFPVNQLTKDFEEATGQKVNADADAYKLALNSRNSDMISFQIINKNLVDSEGKVVEVDGKPIGSLKGILQPIKGRKMHNDFIDYLINKHAETRMKRGEDVFPDEMKMSPEKSAAKADNYEKQYPHFEDVAHNIYQFNRHLGEKWLVDTGIITKEAWQQYLKDNPFYVPNNRVFTELEKSRFGGRKTGFANQSNPVKEATGSKRKIVDPIESIIEHVAQYVKTAKQNEVMQNIVKYLEKEPEALQGWAEVVGKEKANIDDLLKQDGVDGVIKEVEQSFQQAMNKPDLTKGNIVTAIVNGEKVHLRVNDPSLLEAVAQLPKQAYGPILNVFAQVTRTMKLLTTGVNPVFSLTRNLFRDIPEAYKNSKTTSNPVKFSYDLIHAFASVLGHGKLYEDYRNLGGGHSSPIAANRNMLSQSKNRVLPAQSALGKVGKVVKGGFHALENFNSAIETAPRLAEFKRNYKGDYASAVKALYEANDVTVNFNKHGEFSKSLDAFFPYFNAAVQGLDKWVRSYKDNPVATTLKSVAAVTVPTLWLYSINHNDPNYQKLSQYTKDNYFVIPKGDGTFWKIPKPRETGFVFSTLVERGLRQFSENDPKAWDQFYQTFTNVFGPPGIQSGMKGENPMKDTILGPGFDLAANKDFAGRTIVPAALQKLSPPNQYDTKTSEVSKILGQKFNQSPKQIDYLMKSYLGVLAQLGIPATTKGNGGTPLSRISNTLSQNVTADPTYSNDILNNFYNTKTKLDQAAADFKATQEKSKDYNPGIQGTFDKLSQELAQLRKMSLKAQSDPKLDDTARKLTLKSIQNKMLDVAQKANQMYDQKTKAAK